VIALGNEHDLLNAVGLLRACKESILSMYATRCSQKRGDMAAMMTATTWMDAKAALEFGFIDAIADERMDSGPSDAAKPRAVDRAEAEAKVQAWLGRHRQKPSRPTKGVDHTSSVLPAVEQANQTESQGGTAQTTTKGSNGGSPPKSPDPNESPGSPGTPIAQLQKRLGLLMPTKR
jgi:enoyl-CoA hydratase/carnithine racemase